MNSLNDFIYRGTRPKPMAVPSPKRISTPAGQRLSTILENQQNPTSPQPSNRSDAQRFNFGTPPRASEEKRPPSYSSKEGTITDAERAAFANEPKTLRERLSRRGGWKRLGLIVGLVLLAIIALAVGLGVGLTVNSGDDNNDNGNGNANNPGSQSLGPFPAGYWTFETFLTDVSTDCVSTAETWNCWPYLTYSDAGASSSASLNWIIKSSSSDSNDYVISSSSNPLTIDGFHGSPLTLRGENTPEERYTFTIESVSKQVLPSVSLTGDNNRTLCFFNSSSVNASIYTRKPITLPTRGDQSSNNQFPSFSHGQTYKPWDHAVEISQESPGGANSPQCYRTWNNKPVGNPIDLTTTPVSSQCRCGYRNFQS